MFFDTVSGATKILDSSGFSGFWLETGESLFVNNTGGVSHLDLIEFCCGSVSEKATESIFDISGRSSIDFAGTYEINLRGLAYLTG